MKPLLLSTDNSATMKCCAFFSCLSNSIDARIRKYSNCFLQKENCTNQDHNWCSQSIWITKSEWYYFRRWVSFTQILSGLCIIDNLVLASTFNNETNILHHGLETSVINGKVEDLTNESKNCPLEQQ